MDEPRMRPVDLPRDEPPPRRERPARHLAGFAAAALLTALGAGSILAHVLDGDQQLIEGGAFGWIVGWVAWLTVAEAMRVRAPDRRPRGYVVGLVVAVAIGVVAGVAASRAGLLFAFTLPTAILAALVGGAWLWRLGR